MRTKLFVQAVIKMAAGFVLMAALLFLPAGTLSYGGAWRLLFLLFAPMTVLGALMLVRKPELLAKRLDAKEKRGEQKAVVGVSALMFVLGFVLAGLDFRFGWTAVPAAVSDAASAVFLLAYGLYAEVIRENAWLSRTIEVRPEQKVVDTGLYALVRHPMYTSTLLLFLAMPLILGSFAALAVFLFYPAVIVRRIRDEETLLRAELAGYEDYMEKVKFRLVPFVW